MKILNVGDVYYEVGYLSLDWDEPPTIKRFSTLEKAILYCFNYSFEDEIPKFLDTKQFLKRINNGVWEVFNCQTRTNRETREKEFLRFDGTHFYIHKEIYEGFLVDEDE